MPWRSPSDFAARHNKKLRGAAAGKARDQATAMIRRGVPEGMAIATANRTGNRMMARQRAMYDHPRSRAARKE